jgi:uroporphyrinogen decarboxylase
MNRSQLVLDVIAKKNKEYLPSQITFAHGSKKMEVAGRLGMTEEELDVYLGNHIKITAQLDDMIQVDKADKYRMGVAIEKKRMIPEKGRENMVFDLWGMQYDLNEGGYFNYAHPLANCEEDDALLDNFQAPDLSDMDMLFQIADEDLKKYGEDFLVILSGYNGIWEKAYQLMGMEQFLCLLMTEPEKACRIMDVITEYKVEVAKETVRRGYPIGHYGDDLGTQISTIVSEDAFVKYFLPRFKKVFRVFKDAGLPVQMHSCGKITPFIPHLIDAGLDVLEPVQACLDFKFLKREYGKYLTFYGGVDTQDLLTFRTPQEVYDGTLEVIKVLGEGGGLIIGPSQEVMNNVPAENVLALMKAIKTARGE